MARFGRPRARFSLIVFFLCQSLVSVAGEVGVSCSSRGADCGIPRVSGASDAAAAVRPALGAAASAFGSATEALSGFGGKPEPVKMPENLVSWALSSSLSGFVSMIGALEAIAPSGCGSSPSSCGRRVEDPVSTAIDGWRSGATALDSIGRR
jgi:hypothetical protein